MRTSRKLIAALTVVLLLTLLTACRSAADRNELTNYIGKSVSTFERRSGTKLEQQGTGVYKMENVVQVMAPDKAVNAITLLNGAGEYSVFGIRIGTSRAEVDGLLADIMGKEIAKTVNQEKNTVTYTYLKNDKELYITYDAEKDTVTELAYYVMDGSKEPTPVQEEPTNSGELMLMVGDSKVYYNEAMVYLKSAQENYETDYGNSIWQADILGNGDTFGNLIKDEVIQQITEIKIIRAEAEKEGITLTEEELADANAYAKEHYKGLTSQDIDKYLITEELLRQIYADNLLAEKIFESKTINVDTEVSDLEARQITVQQLLIYSVDYDDQGKAVPLSAEEKAAAYEKVQSLLEQAKTTDNFYALAETNTESDQIEYTFGRGQGPEEFSASFEQAAFTLKTGQVSNIVTTDYGWHILYCVSDNNVDATIQKKEEIIDGRRSELFADLYATWTENYDVIVNSEAWDTISFE